MLETFLFFLFALTAVASAFVVVFSKTPLYSVLALVITMFAIAGLFVLLDAHFLAMIQILVYAGAVLVLFLLILMFLGIQGSVRDLETKSFIKQMIPILLILVFLGEYLIFLAFSESLERSGTTIQGTVENMGRSLFSEHLLPFELIAIVFFVAIIGIVHLTGREENG